MLEGYQLDWLTLGIVIVSGKGLSIDTFITVTVFCDIPGATTDDMFHHKISLAEKTHKKRIIHVGTNNIYSNIDTIGNCQKIYNYVKTNASKTELVLFQKLVAREIS